MEVSVSEDKETVWLSLDQMAELFKRDRSAIGKHVRNIFDYDEELAREVFAAVPKVARALRDFDPEVRGLNILLNNEEVASQTVFHSHIHLLPRYTENDDFGLKWAYNEDKYSDTQLDQLQKSIVNELGDD